VEKEQKSKDSIDLFSESRLTIFLQSTAITIVMIAVIGGLSYSLDKFLGTFPIIFIIGIVAAYPLTQLYLFRKFRKFSRKKLKDN